MSFSPAKVVSILLAEFGVPGDNDAPTREEKKIARRPILRDGAAASVDVETDKDWGLDVTTDDESDWNHFDDEGEENSSTTHENVIHFDTTAVTVGQVTKAIQHYRSSSKGFRSNDRFLGQDDNIETLETVETVEPPTTGESSIVHKEEESVKVLPVASTPPERYDGMTYDGLIHKERQKRFPVSYYHVQEMNKGPVDYAPRLAEIPSQYQLESLSEMFVFDYPKFYKSEKRCDVGEMDLEEAATTPPTSRSDYLPLLLAETAVREPVATNPHEVYSQYVSEMLY